MTVDANLDVFFSEQDKRMNMPDDDFDDYLGRMATHRKNSSREQSLTELAPRTDSTYSGHVELEPAKSQSVDVRPLVAVEGDPGAPEVETVMKRKSSLKRKISHHEAVSAVKRSKPETVSLYGLSDIDEGPRMPKELPTLTGPLKGNNEPNTREAIGPTNVVTPASSKSTRTPVPAPLETSPSPQPHAGDLPQNSKRKASPDISDPSSRKKRSVPLPLRLRPRAPSQTTIEHADPTDPNPEGVNSDMEEHAIRVAPPAGKTTTSPPAAKIRVDVKRTESKNGGISPRPPTDTKAAEVAIKTTRVRVPNMTDPPTSPIEDASEILTTAFLPEVASTQVGKPSLKSAPSRLYLEVKERIANHATTRRRNKVIKLGVRSPDKHAPHTSASSDFQSDSSIISVSSSPSPSRSSSPMEIDGPHVKKVKATKLPDKSASKPVKGKKKEKPQPVTPVEYAQMLREKMLDPEKAPNKSNVVQFLKGKSIFYAGGDMSYASERTRGRMDIIIKYGGDLLPTYDASVVTHIVTDAQMRPTLRALGLKRLEEIPEHVPTVKWGWIVSGIGRAPLMGKGELVPGKQDEVWLHAAFSSRINAGVNTAKSFNLGKGKARFQDVEESSRISEFTQDKPQRQVVPQSGPDFEDDGDISHNDANDPIGAPLSPPISPQPQTKLGEASSSKVRLNRYTPKLPINDPLAEFYAQAKAERDSGWARQGEAEESDAEGSGDEIEDLTSALPKRRGFTCDNKEIQRTTCVNQDIIVKLQELMELHKAKPGDEDHWRAFSYSKCIRALRNHPRRIRSFSEARTIRGVGEKTALKIMEILQTGELRRIGYERTDDVKATRLFQGIYGVGQSTTFKWYASGCRTLDDIKSGKGGVKLTPAQEIGVRFYDDINDRMPRSEAKAIFELIKPIALSIDPKLFVEIMGSYRRGKADCGDIDIMITRPPDDGKTHIGVLGRLLHELHAAGIVTEDLALPENPDDLEAIYRGLCRLPEEGSRRRRIDFLTVPWVSRGAALLYYTGDGIFNRAIRLKAGVLGFSLNQKGLFSGVVRDPRDRRIKMNVGTLVASETEEEIFKILGVPWQEPHERVRG